MDFTLPETLPEILSLATQFAVLLLVLLLILVTIRIFSLLGIAKELANSIAEIVETVNMVLWQPVRFFTGITKKVNKIIGRK